MPKYGSQMIPGTHSENRELNKLIEKWYEIINVARRTWRGLVPVLRKVRLPDHGNKKLVCVVYLYIEVAHDSLR